MARFAPFSDQRPAPLVEVVTLTNELTGQTDEIALQYMDDVLANKSASLAQRLSAQYVGYPDQGVEPESFLAVGGEELEISEMLCQNVATVFVMQAPRPDKGMIYTVEEIIAFVATNDVTNIWTQLQEHTQEINTKGNKRKKRTKRVKSLDGIGLRTPSDGSNPTPKLLPETMPCSAPSTNGSAISVSELEEPKVVMRVAT